VNDIILGIKNLKVSVDGNIILPDISLKLERGKNYLFLGPNGSGKSTLLKVIAGIGNYKIDSGEILYNGTSIKDKNIEEREQLGIGLMMQHPPIIEGVTLQKLIEEIKNSRITKTENKILKGGNIHKLLRRNLNENYSGGEIKQSEMYQISHMNPALVLIDEPESGVDIENINYIGKLLSNLLTDNPNITFLIITHTGKIQDYLPPCNGLVLMDGKIIKEHNHGPKLIEEIKNKGFDQYL